MILKYISFLNSSIAIIFLSKKNKLQRFFEKKLHLVGFFFNFTQKIKCREHY